MSRVLQNSRRAGLVLVFGISIDAATAGDCFNDKAPLRSGETVPESLRITDADLRWLTGTLEAQARTVSERTRSMSPAPAIADPNPAALITDAIAIPVGNRD